MNSNHDIAEKLGPMVTQMRARDALIGQPMDWSKADAPQVARPGNYAPYKEESN